MKIKVRVVYRNGHVETLRCTTFEVHRLSGKIARVAWTGASPAPLHIGVSEIAAVFQLPWWRR